MKFSKDAGIAPSTDPYEISLLQEWSMNQQHQDLISKQNRGPLSVSPHSYLQFSRVPKGLEHRVKFGKVYTLQCFTGVKRSQWASYLTIFQ